MLHELVLYLLGKNAHRESVRLTTKEMASGLGVSQQTISRWMIELENQGYIERKGFQISLTRKAVSEAEKVLVKLKLVLDKDRKFHFKGKVIEGFGTGAAFVGLKQYKEGIAKKLGFKPFPGTLNIKIEPEDIEQRLALRSTPPIKIKGFKSGKKYYGILSAYKARIFGEPAAIVFPEMSHHGLDVIELVSPDNLRKRYGLKNGSEVEVFVE